MWIRIEVFSSFSLFVLGKVWMATPLLLGVEGKGRGKKVGSREEGKSTNKF